MASDDLVPPTNSDHALHSVQRSNKIISISTVVALILIVAMLGFALLQLGNLVNTQQSEIKAAADRNGKLTEEVQRTTDKQLKAIADYLECIAKTNPNTRTNAEVDACLNILRKGGEVSYFLGQPTRASLTG